MNSVSLVSLPPLQDKFPEQQLSVRPTQTFPQIENYWSLSVVLSLLLFPSPLAYFIVCFKATVPEQGIEGF